MLVLQERIEKYIVCVCEHVPLTESVCVETQRYSKEHNQLKSTLRWRSTEGCCAGAVFSLGSFRGVPHPLVTFMYPLVVVKTL